MPIKPLVELRVEHSYYATRLCTPAQIVPERQTAARLAGLRLIIKAAAGGLAVLVDLRPDGTPAIPIPETTLRFALLRLPPELEAATELGGIVPGTVFVAAGADKPMRPEMRETRDGEIVTKPAGAASVALSGSPLAESKAAFRVVAPPGVTVSGWDAAGKRLSLAGPAGAVELDYPVAPPRTPGVLAAIEVRISPALVAAAAAGKPLRQTIALQASAARWCYHVVTDLADPLADWRIAHPAADGPPARFAANGSAELTGAETADAFGSELANRTAPLRVLRFVSDAPVPCSEVRARRVALFAGQRQLIAALPNPSPAALRRVGGQPVFGEVLHFVTA